MYLPVLRAVLIAWMVTALVTPRVISRHLRLRPSGKGKRDLFLTIQPLPPGNNPLRRPCDHGDESTQLRLAQGQGVMISAQSHHGDETKQKPIVRYITSIEEPYSKGQKKNEKSHEPEAKERDVTETEDTEKWTGQVFRKQRKAPRQLKRKHLPSRRIKRRQRRKRAKNYLKRSNKEMETSGKQEQQSNEITLKNAPMEPESKKTPMTQDELDEIKFVRQKQRDKNELSGMQAIVKLPGEKMDSVKAISQKTGTSSLQSDRAEAGDISRKSSSTSASSSTSSSSSSKKTSSGEMSKQDLQGKKAELLERMSDSLNEAHDAISDARRDIPMDSHNSDIPAMANLDNVNNALGKILTELDMLKAESPPLTAPGGHSLKHEGLVCNLTGSWDSEVAGSRFDLLLDSTGRLHVHLGDKTPPCPKPLFNDRWHLSAEAPFHAFGPFIIKAYFKPQRRIGVFVGECRTCEGIELITGEWILAHEARDCSDVLMSRESILDVWRRDNIRQLQSRKLEQLHKKRHSKLKGKECVSSPTVPGNLENHLHYAKDKHVDPIND